MKSIFALITIVLSCSIFGCNEKVASSIADAASNYMSHEARRSIDHAGGILGDLQNAQGSSSDSGGGLYGVGSDIFQGVDTNEYMIPGTNTKLIRSHTLKTGPNESNVPTMGTGCVIPESVKKSLMLLRADGFRMSYEDFVARRDSVRAELDPVLVSKGYRLSEQQFNSVTRERLSLIQQTRR